jgi:hypothetical protein
MRHDDQHLSRIKKHAGEQHFRYLQETPFFYFDANPAKHWKDNGEFVIRLIPMLPFNHMIWMNVKTNVLHELTYDPEKWHLTITDYYNPETADIGVMNSTKEHKRRYNIPPLMLQNHRFEFTEDPMNPDSALTTVIRISYLGYRNGLAIKSEDSTYVYIRNNEDKLLDFERDKQNVLYDVFAEIAMLEHIFQQVEDKHLVRVTEKPAAPINNRQAKKSNKKYTAKYHYVYMDCPHVPSTKNSDGKVTHHKRGHHKRAHWRTLTNPRFSKHPKFGQRIRVKACWVGPLEWSDNGKIYTVHNPD